MAAKENYETALDLSSSEIHRELIKINNSSYQTIHIENPVRQSCLFEYIYLQNIYTN